jgi:hypothetical protein
MDKTTNGAGWDILLSVRFSSGNGRLLFSFW